MFTHETIWLAIDRLAVRAGYSTSGLARRAGLDPTTFNRSKRIAVDGKPRWPSTESIARVLDAAQITMPDFLELMAPDAAEEMAVTITTSLYAPWVKEGDILVVDRKAALRKGDRVAVSLRAGNIALHHFIRMNEKEAECAALMGGNETTIYKTTDIHWLARISHVRF
ncbi:MAG: hypothetical protein WC043_10735 [Pseudobdellovibrionaceae bacterium]